MYKLKDFIDINKLDLELLNKNANADNYFEENTHLIKYNYIVLNESALHILEKK